MPHERWRGALCCGMIRDKLKKSRGDGHAAKDAELMRILDDPDKHFTIVPEGAMKYAQFMYRIGTLKNEPAGRRELFFPDIADRPGS